MATLNDLALRLKKVAATSAYMIGEFVEATLTALSGKQDTLLNTSSDFIQPDSGKLIIKNSQGSTMTSVYSDSQSSDGDYFAHGISHQHLVSAGVIKRWLDEKQNTINSDNKLSADLIDDAYSTQKVVNVKPDWNAASGNVAEILNKPTIPAAQVQSDWNANSGVAQILNKPTIPTITIRTWTTT